MWFKYQVYYLVACSKIEMQNITVKKITTGLLILPKVK